MKTPPCLCLRRWQDGLLPAAFLAALLSSGTLFAAVIGTNPPVPALTRERIENLPMGTRAAWQDYLKRSTERRKSDQAYFRNEMRAHGIPNSTPPPADHGVRSLPLNNQPVWYRGAEASNIAANVISFQTPAGGWSKNLNLARHARAPGELFGPENGSQLLGPDDFDAPLEGRWNYVGTIDNDATTSELRFLAKVIAAVGSEQGASYKTAFLHGLDYLLAAQYPNGGWPQVWPLQGGYHDAITVNDGAMLNVLELLRNISEGTDEFGFVSAENRLRAGASFQRGLTCLLAAQVQVNQRRTVWCQQYEALTLEPASARNYELPALTSGESAGILSYLMELPSPDSKVVAAVHAAAAWFEQTKLMNVAFKNTGTDGRHLVAAPGGGPIWSRYYQIGDDRPIFGDRDKSIHDTVDEISFERRQGYSWYSDSAKRVLEHYARWSRQHPVGK